MVLALSVGLIGCSRSANRQEPATSPQASTQSATAVIQPTAQPAMITGAKPSELAGKRTEKRGARVDSCTLLSARQVQSIQGEPLKETKSSESSSHGFGISQCFFTLPTFTNSISLVVTQRGDGPDARDPKEFWRETFRDREADSEPKDKDRDGNRDKDQDKTRNQGREEREAEEESAKPLKVSHLGDEAFWTGNAVGGALYVLKGNTFVRVSVGGSGAQRAQIKKAQALAQLIVKQL
jgi:hypothetical protein